jgi:hypothetical protein
VSRHIREHTDRFFPAKLPNARERRETLSLSVSDGRQVGRMTSWKPETQSGFITPNDGSSEAIFWPGG